LTGAYGMRRAQEKPFFYLIFLRYSVGANSNLATGALRPFIVYPPPPK
jgi:hypothetical protein